MAGPLKTPQHDQAHQVADVQAISRGIEPGDTGAASLASHFRCALSVD